MATPANKIGLTVPDRAPTPCDGRAQHYRRPGDQSMQETRTFINGTSMTFGSQDFIDDFKPGDPFFEQVLQVESVKEEIRAVRQQYRITEYNEASAETSAWVSRPSETLNKDRGDRYKTPAQSHQDFFAHARGGGMPHNVMAHTMAGMANYQRDDFGVAADGPALAGLAHNLRGLRVEDGETIKNDLPGSHVALASRTHGPSMSALTAPRGGLLGVKKVQGFGNHRFGQKDGPFAINIEDDHPDLPPPPPMTYPPGTSQSEINRSEALRYEALLQEVLIIALQPGELDYWGWPGPGFRFFLIDPPGPSGHPLIANLYRPDRQLASWVYEHNANPRNNNSTHKYLQATIFQHRQRDQSLRFLELDRLAGAVADAARNRIDGGQPEGANDQGQTDQQGYWQPAIPRSPTPLPSRSGRLRAPYVGMEERVLARGNYTSPLRNTAFGPPRFEGGKTFNEMIGLNDQPTRPSSAGFLSNPTHEDL